MTVSCSGGWSCARAWRGGPEPALALHAAVRGFSPVFLTEEPDNVMQSGGAESVGDLRPKSLESGELEAENS